MKITLNQCFVFLLVVGNNFLYPALFLPSAIVHAETIPMCETELYKVRYPRSEYPHVIGPNGCDYSRDTWPVPSGRVVNFVPACDNHDRCYFTLGANWNICNEKFANDLESRCIADLKPINAAYISDLAACTAIVATYYTAVQTGVALGAFDNAQDSQREHDKWVGINCSLPPNPCDGISVPSDKWSVGTINPYLTWRTSYRCDNGRIVVKSTTNYCGDNPMGHGCICTVTGVRRCRDGGTEPR